VARATRAPRTVTSLLAMAAAALMLTLSGCSAANPITTSTPYSPSDGVRLALGGQVSAANLMVVSPSRQGAGVLLGALRTAPTPSAPAEPAVAGPPAQPNRPEM